MKMKDLVTEIAEQTGTSKADTAKIIKEYLTVIKTAVLNAGKFTTELGTFKLKERKARTCRNPKTGGSIQIPAKKVITFSCSTALKTTLNP